MMELEKWHYVVGIILGCLTILNTIYSIWGMFLKRESERAAIESAEAAKESATQAKRSADIAETALDVARNSAKAAEISSKVSLESSTLIFMRFAEEKLAMYCSYKKHLQLIKQYIGSFNFVEGVDNLQNVYMKNDGYQLDIALLKISEELRSASWANQQEAFDLANKKIDALIDYGN